ncbi:MAG: hypothetical protein M0P72_06290 [Metallibacterium scheffleri]|jgi:hypothetical protein|uniref:hypothetical protein n=1 Tax=Metallibacterium scheffleri TaxID=993689 RepID=UPI0026F10E42|nr:hypothetical protein [Metallibacterium scheffleri]MCK9366740.1 hypothetical protein [Metallibacterium scheffleri]
MAHARQSLVARHPIRTGLAHPLQRNIPARPRWAMRCRVSAKPTSLDERLRLLATKVNPLDAHERDLIEHGVRLETFVDCLRRAITRAGLAVRRHRVVRGALRRSWPQRAD